MLVSHRCGRVLVEELEIDAAELHAPAETLPQDADTLAYVAVDGRAAGLLGIADPVKPEAADAIRDLQSEGIRVVMLTCWRQLLYGRCCCTQAWHQ